MSVLNGESCMMAKNGVVDISIKPCNKLVVKFCIFSSNILQDLFMCMCMWGLSYRHFCVS